MNINNLARRVKGRFKSFFYDPMEKRHALSGDPSFWKEDRNFQFNFLLQAGLKSHHHFLDFGCGTLVGGIPLIGYLQPERYYGIEIRPKVIDESRKEIEQNQLENKNPKLLLCDSIKNLSINAKFDYILAFFVIFLLNDNQIIDLFNFVSKHLENNGVFFANSNLEGRNPNIKWQGFRLNSKDLDFYKNLSDQVGLKVEDVGSLGELDFNFGTKEISKHRMLKFTFS